MNKNRFFEEMTEAGNEYQAAKDERLKERDRLKENDDWDGVRAFDEKEKAEHPFPFTDGALRAWRAYKNSLAYGCDAFEVEDLPWPKDMKDFVGTLRKAGIRTAVITDQSTGLMDGIYGMVANGCSMGALQIVTRANDHRFGSREPEKKNGISFEIR